MLKFIEEKLGKYDVIEHFQDFYRLKIGATIPIG